MSRSFSERMGIIKPKLDLQINDIDERLKNRIWNSFEEFFFAKITSSRLNYTERLHKFAIKVCDELLGLDTIDLQVNKLYRDDVEIRNILRQKIFSYQWYMIYNFIEYAIKNELSVKMTESFINKLNYVLKQENSGYRIVNGLVTPITSQQEINEVEEAAQSPYNSVNKHLKTAIQLFSDREKPDYRNSIKEAISAVESLCCIVVGDDKTTLGKALTKIESQGGLHGSLKTAFSALYGYTSDEGGIRHKLLEDSQEIKFEDAKFMLVSCSAFINYLIAKNTV